MRIILFTNTYPPTLNGVANATHLYRRGLSERGHEVRVFAPAPVGEDPFADDPFVYRYRAMLVPGEVDYTLALPRPFSLRTHRQMQALEADIVHTQHPAWVGEWGLKWARRRSIPVVSTAHTQYELYANRTILPTSWIEPIVTRHVVRYFNGCQVVTTPAEWMRDKLMSRGVRPPVELVANPVDLEALARPRRQETRRRLGFDDRNIVVGYLGRLSPVKNLGCVIDAVALLAQRWPEIRLLVAGDGASAPALRKRAALRLGDRAVFTGGVPHSEVAHYYAAMDCFATASHSETQPLAYLESMHVGTPLVALATPGAAEMIEHGVNGLLVPPQERAKGLAEAIERVLASPELADRLREGGRRFAREHHYPAVAQRLEEVYALARERLDAAQ